MRNLALQHSDREADEVQHQLAPRPLGGIRSDIAIADECQQVQIRLGVFADGQEPLQKTDQRPQVVAGWNHRDQNRVRYQDRIPEHFPILLSRIPRRAIDEHDVVRIDRQCCFEEITYVRGLQPQDFVRAVSPLSRSSPGVGAGLATISIHNQCPIASGHEGPRQVGSGRGFAATSLFVCNRYDRRHARSLPLSHLRAK